ncbi:putative lipid II flippase FtsW [Microbacterium saperdae]|uniref:Probable peptidoglycan glycosyltransferase FtsW n=1 Tax=Microbacterium saperdae TaxID=69368 RepID=A0A543BLP2_9MICO|nr:putative lipid II flippase FtsW [Microbacterium saperdae]TQL85713.1 cell division-specific peptidoglycan biosynthesis regulator FtsW [Microbacterium saperdae]GGM53573.1 cell division protein FtsW [Microbacterium saperdae]
MTQVARPPGSESGGLAARVSLGRRFVPVSSEFLMIASTALLLTLFGLVMVLSATSATAIGNGESPWSAALRQGIFALLGVPLMFLVSRLPIAFLKRMAWPALFGAVALQLLVFTPLGIADGGNRNWIQIAGFQLQPSEFLKLALALWIGYVLLRKQAMLGTWHHVFIPVVPVGALAIGTVLGGKDLGTAMVLVLILLGCLFFSGVKLRLFIIPVILGVGAVLAYALSSVDRMRRITASCDNLDLYYTDCYQSIHGIWGMASGGIFGLGLGNSQEKYGWLPAAGNDFIFAIVGEELGLIGCIVVLALFTFFTIGAFHIIRKTNDPFIRVAAGGITVWIVGQAVLNIGVVIGIFPVMGVPLPFMSQGGTALLAVLLACGVLLAFARTIPAVEPGGATQRPAAPRGSSAGRGRVTK